MRRRDAGAQVAISKFRRHRGEASDLAADADRRQNPYAREQQQQGYRHNRHFLVKTAVGGCDQAVLGQSDQDVKSGIPDRRRPGRRPDVGLAVRIGQLAEGLAVRCGRKSEQLGVCDRGARECRFDILPGATRTVPFLSTSRISPPPTPSLVDWFSANFCRLSEASRTNFSSALSERTGYAICNTDIPVSRPNAACSVTTPFGDQGLLEIVAIPQVEAAVALQRVAEQAAVRIDGQYAR